MDSQYLTRVLEGDVSAFRYFVDKYKDMSFSVAMSIVKNEQDAEEVVQDAFINAYRKLASFQQKSKFSTWLYKIVVNQAISKVRLKKASFTGLENVNMHEHDLHSVNDAISELDSDEQSKIVNDALSKIPERESLLLRLFYIEESSIDEIAEITGLTKSNIKVILFRARNSLYNMLVQRGINKNKVLV